MAVSLIGNILTIPVRIITSDPFNIPSGTIILKKGNKTLGAQALNDVGITTFSINSNELGIGSHILTAYYAGSKHHAASSFTIVQEIAEPITTTCIVSSKNNNIDYEQNITLVCNIFAKEEINQGTVRFFYNDGEIISNITNIIPNENGGTALLTINSSILNIGDNGIFAVYEGAGKFLSSSSDKFIQIINKIKSNNIVVSNINPSHYNQSITLTAIISGAYGIPQGNVIFYSGETALCNPIPLSDGKANFHTSSLAGGSHNITAKYSENNKYSSSKSLVLNQLVNSAKTDTILSLDGNVLTATITSPGGTPNGNISFYINNNLIKSIQLDRNGIVSFILNHNNTTITAKYSGTTNYSSSSSNIEIH